MVDVEDGQKTGFFLDQKYNRLAVQNLCRRIQPKQVLDCFTHTGPLPSTPVWQGPHMCWAWTPRSWQ